MSEASIMIDKMPGASKQLILYTGRRLACHSALSLLFMNTRAWGPQVSCKKHYWMRGIAQVMRKIKLEVCFIENFLFHWFRKFVQSYIESF